MSHEPEGDIQRAFAAEARDLLRQVERALHGLAGGEPAERPERCQDMLRGLHTLKGAAAAAGHEGVKRSAHLLEDLVRGAREGLVPVTGPGLEAIFAGLEHLYEALGTALGETAALEATPGPGEPVATVEGVSRRADEEYLRVPPARVDALHALVSELVLCRLQQEGLTRRLVEARERMGEAMERWRELGARLEPCRRTLARAQWAPLKAARDACGPALTGAWQTGSAVAR